MATLTVKRIGQPQIVLNDVDLTWTVRELKERLIDLEVDEGMQRVGFDGISVVRLGMAMDDMSVLGDIDIENDTCVTMFRTARLGASPGAALPHPPVPRAVGPAVDDELILIRFKFGGPVHDHAFELDVARSSTIDELKNAVAEAQAVNAAGLKVLLQGRIAEDDEVVDDIELDDASLVTVLYLPELIARGGSGGRGGGDGLGAFGGAANVCGTEEDGVVRIHFAVLTGGSFEEDIPLGMAFGRVKVDIIAAPSGIPPAEIELIHGGRSLPDGDTAAVHGMGGSSVIHVVRRPIRSAARAARAPPPVLSERISKESLRANCTFCHTAGARLALRPLCHECHSEAVALDGEYRATGSTWGSLATQTAKCHACDGDGVRVDWGFLCKARIGGRPCPARIHLGAAGASVGRCFFTIYEPGRNSIVSVLDEMWGQAHFFGLQKEIAR
jgi:hypothetical protein